MKPGRELDQNIAEIVLGLRKKLVEAKNQKTYESVRKKIEFCPNYSTDISAAFELVPYISKNHFADVFSLMGPSDESDQWFAGFERKWHGRAFKNVYDRANGETAAHAICMAALAVSVLNTIETETPPSDERQMEI